MNGEKSVTKHKKTGRTMRLFYSVVICIVMMLFLSGNSKAFELDGLKSGMSMEQSRTVLKGISYENFQVLETTLLATDKSLDSHRRISASFCKGKLVQVQKGLQPLFNNFTRLVEQKTKEFGNPTSAWVRVPDVESGFDVNSVSFSWHDGSTAISTTYSEFSVSKQLDILYADKNSCWDVDWL